MNTQQRILRLPKKFVAELRAMLKAAAPQECCGLLLGSDAPGVRWVERLYRTKNRATQPQRRFLIGSEDVWRSEMAAHEAGLVLLGTYHSHPHGDAHPSADDGRHAWPGLSMLVVGAHDMRSWVWNARQFEEEVITDDGA